MTLIELSSPPELTDFIKSNPVCLVTFSAHWCGPCKASKPQLAEMARSAPVPFGYVHESDLGDFLHTFNVRAFPTYVVFVDGREAGRVQGVNFAGIQALVATHAGGGGGSIPETGGHALGGSHTPEQARALRLARLEEAAKALAAATAAREAAAPATAKPEAMDTSGEGKAAAGPKEGSSDTMDASMEDAEQTEGGGACRPVTNPADGLDQEAVKTLTDQMGFTLIRAQKGLLYSPGGSVESAIEWLMEHQDDEDIDDPIPAGALVKAQSYKCNECGKVLSNMANLELHANKTGHSDFEESTLLVKPLTDEEKAAKIAEIKELLKAKRAEREEAEKVDHIEREKQRRSMGKEVAKTREEMEKEARKREAYARKREKMEQKRERDRIREELEKDKRERMANKGKLKGRLGVDGYAPDGIQYDTTALHGDEATEEPAAQKPKTATTANTSKIDDYISKIASYRAGGDGGKCLKVLKLLIGNAADNPGEEKFKKVNTETNAYKTKVKPFIGAKSVLLAVGFTPQAGDPTHLVLNEDADIELMRDTKAKLEKALATYG